MSGDGVSPGEAQPNWERRYESLIGWVPYVTLLISTVLSVARPDQTWGERAATIGLSAVAAAWVLVGYTLAGPRRQQQWWIRIYFAGLIAIAAVLMVRQPLFFVFVITGFFHAYLLRPWPVMVLGVLATSLTINSMIPGFPDPTQEGLWLFAIVVVVQTVAISGGIFIGERLTELSEQRRLAVTELEAALVENAGLQVQLMTQAREAGVLDERQRMAREIHDTLAQGLTGVITQLEAANQAKSDAGELQRHLDNAARLARESLAEARRSVQAVRPAPLDGSRLPEALADVAERWSILNGVPVALTTTGDVRWLHPEVEVTLLRVTQEGLANVAQHAEATRVGVTLSYMNDLVTLDVRDDGAGFEPVVAANGAGQDGSFGLTVMRQRVEALAGKLEVESEPGVGTSICASIPAVPAEAVGG